MMDRPTCTFKLKLEGSSVKTVTERIEAVENLGSVVNIDM